MSRRKPVPDEARVREALAQMRIEADSGATRVSVLGLARRLGMSNATFWRNYREIAIEIRQAPQTSDKPARVSRPGNEAKLADRNASLSRERDALAGQLEAALAHLCRLTTDNARLREELEAARAVSHLDTARATRKNRTRSPRLAPPWPPWRASRPVCASPPLATGNGQRTVLKPWP